jgi:dipeptidyl aminopeptidase/acylaminoacyl peptidase
MGQMPTQTTSPKRPMTFADLQTMRRVSDPQISPSGNWVLFSVVDVSLKKNTKTSHLWVMPIDGSAKERQVTEGAGEGNGRFSPDGKWVSITQGDQIVVDAWDEATGSVNFVKRKTELSGGPDNAIWTPDSRQLIFTMDVYPECSDKPTWEEEEACNKALDQQAASSQVKAQVWTSLLYRHWNAYTGQKRSHLFVMDADLTHLRDLTPKSVVGEHEVPTFSLGGPLGFAVSPEGKELAYVAKLDPVPAESTNNDIYVIPLVGPATPPRKISTSPGSDDGPAYSPDGRWLAWRSQARAGFESDRYRLMTIDRSSGLVQERRPKGGVDLSVDEFVWDPSSSFVFLTSAQRGQEPLMGLQIGGDSELRVLAAQGEFSDVRAGVDSQVAVRMTATHPAEIVRFKNGRPFQISGLNDAIVLQLSLSEMETFWFSGANGTKVQGFLVRPPNFDATKTYPLKLLIHGGPQGAWGDAWSYRWNPELFAANGYVVVMINPRGSTGYGQPFVDEVSGDWGGRPYEDLMKGLDYAEKTFPFIDKTRECALGASYGGFMANYILTHTDRFACIVSHDGLYNPQSAFGTTEELWFNEWEFRPLNGAGPHATVEESSPAHPWDFYDKSNSDDPFRRWSPMQAIKNAKTPTLVIHSQKDYRLDLSEGLQLFTALQLRGVPSKFLYFPDEGHWVLKPQNSELWYKTVNDWVDQWTHTNEYAK